MRWRSSIIRGATASASRSMRASRSPAGVAGDAARAADAKAAATVARQAVLQRGMSSSMTRKQTATRPSPVRGVHENLPILYPEGDFLIPGGVRRAGRTGAGLAPGPGAVDRTDQTDRTDLAPQAEGSPLR